MDGNKRSWFQFFSKLLDIRVAYGEIRSDETARAESTTLGKKAIFYNVLFLLFMAIGVIGVIFGVKILNEDSIIVGFIVLITGIAMAISSLFQFVLAMTCTIYQLRLNKKAIGWVMLAVSLLIIVGAVVAVILGINL